METTHEDQETTAPTEIEPVKGTGASEIVSYDERQREIIKSVLGADLTDDELDFALINSQRTGLDIFSRQMHVWKQQGKMIMMTSIDGLRLIARRTGKYSGRSEIQWMGADGVWVDAWIKEGHPLAARCSVRHMDDPEPTRAVALWAEFAQYVSTDNGRKLRNLWASKPTVMLGKCAEAAALRAAFPVEMSGFYTEDEINTAEDLMAAQKADPDSRPGAGSDATREALALLEALPDEARAKIEGWWETKYVPAVIQQPFPQVGTLGDGALERFQPGSPHIDKAMELLTKATEVAGAGAPATVPQPDPAGASDTPADPGGGDEQPPGSPSPAPEAAAFTDLELSILDALVKQVEGTGAEIAASYGLRDDQSFKTALAALFRGDLVELVPESDLPDGVTQGRGPARIYRRNEVLLAQIEAEESESTEETK